MKIMKDYSKILTFYWIVKKLFTDLYEILISYNLKDSYFNKLIKIQFTVKLNELLIKLKKVHPCTGRISATLGQRTVKISDFERLQ